jgi:sulfatase maturation enzyme AslB (radical SAM superfamily)
MEQNIICVAPINSILIDTNKGLRPCCYYGDGFLGNANKNTIAEIVSNDKWKALKQQVKDNVWPAGCTLCKSNEESFGTSLRQAYWEHATQEEIDSDKITVIEFNGSNICNLACLHCHSLYSSKWYSQGEKAKKVLKTYDIKKQERALEFRPLKELLDDADGSSLQKTHLPNPDLVIENLKGLDLSRLRTMHFRGGEPLLNSETTAVLKYADEIGLLDKVEVSITTNATYITQEIIDLLKKCRIVHINLSVDGIGELFNYIRYGEAKFDSIEPTIAKLNEVEGISMLVSVAAMNYSAFSLLEVRDWTVELSKKYKHLAKLPGFNNCVISPNYLSLATLSDPTRKYLIDFYTKNSIEDEFKYVINLLANDYLGDEIHTNWVEYTELMQTVRGNNILDIVPQLADELKLKNHA